MNKYKKYIILIIGVVILFFIFGFGAYNNANLIKNQKQQEIEKKQANTVEKPLTAEEQYKKDYDKIKGIIASGKNYGTLISEVNLGKFLMKYYDRPEVKNELCNLVISKIEEYLKSGNRADDINYGFVAAAFNIYFGAENQKICDLYANNFATELQKNEEQKTKTSTTPTVPTTNNLTSSDGMLELLDYKSEDGYIVGTIRNNSDTTYRYVEVDINLFDANDNQVGSTLTNVNNLEPHKSWKFKAVVLEKNTKKFKIVKIYGTR